MDVREAATSATALAPPADIAPRAPFLCKTDSRRLFGFGILLLSNILSGLCFSFIASQRWRAMSAAVVLFTIAYTQTINLGITVVKLGFDTYLYAALSRNPRVRFHLTGFVMRYSIPAALLFSAVLMQFYDARIAVVCTGTVVLEATCVLMLSEQTARGRYAASATSSALKYPLFFLILFLAGGHQALDNWIVACTLLFTAVVRFALAGWSLQPGAITVVTYRPSFWCAIHHPLNFLLFRADQLLLPALAGRSAATLAAEYAFMAKWPELISGIAGTAGLVWFPVWRRQLKYLRRDPERVQGKLLLAILGYTAVILAGSAIYALGSRQSVSTSLILPFAAHALLVLPVNFCTYLLLRCDRLPGLIGKLLQALSVGAIFLPFALQATCRLTLAWSIPCQLVAFLLLIAFRPWGARLKSYA